MNDTTDFRNWTIRDARLHDRADILQLLSFSHLPIQDLLSSDLKHFAVCVIDQAIVGVIGLEVYDSSGLVRSLAVASTVQSQGIATQLLENARDRALVRGVRALFVLTTTAPKWFEKRGFNRIDRSLVPDAMMGSSQFRELCPATAVCLRMPLV